MHLKDLIVTKASGEQVLFSMDKLRNSMRNAGASDEQIDTVIEEITPRLNQGISTKKIYKWAFAQLKKRSKTVAAKYQLKNALMEFGSDGFIFEDFIAEIFKRKGYETNIGVILQGRCVSHEIDVLAVNKEDQILIECKYHSQPGKISDVKVPLYIQSRFQDVRAHWLEKAELKYKNMSVWVVTNTRFSPDAAQYGRCTGMNLFGWDYPRGEGIKDIIDGMNLYPTTCITSLTKAEKADLLSHGVLLCETVPKHEKILYKIGLSESRVAAVLEEVKGMCGIK